MPEFPSPQRIIQELAETQSWIKDDPEYPRKGEVQAAEYLYEFAQKWSLGNVMRHAIPKDSRRFNPFIKQEPKLSNITIDTGEGRDELLFLHGHYDVINPKDYGGKHGIVQSQESPNIYKGLGSYDMLSGIAAILTALHGMKVATHRRVRSILVFGEEYQSEGTHAAFDSSNNLFETGGVPASALSTEITVDARITDDYHLVVGRPGRVALQADIFGEAIHSGAVKGTKRETLASNRGPRAMLLVPEITDFKKHPHDIHNLMPDSTFSFNRYGSNNINSLSEPEKFTMLLNLHYAHPEEGIAYARHLLHRKFRDLFGDEKFEIDGTPPKRHVPWSEPWLENLSDPKYAFAPRIREFARKVTGQDVPYRVGPGVADENIIAAHNIPVTCVPTRGQDEHKETECVDMNSTTEYVVPVLREAAAYEGILTEK